MQSDDQSSRVPKRRYLRYSFKRFLRYFLILIVGAEFFVSCSGKKSDESLAKTRCGSCHLPPDPSLLDSATWASGVLPEMKFRMGLDPTRLWSIPSAEITTVATAIPNGLITEEEWKRIERYYLENAPKKLVITNMPADRRLESFTLSTPETKIPPLVTLVHYDTAFSRMIIGTRRSKLYLLNAKFSVTDSVILSSPPSDYTSLTADSVHVLQMGKMDPNDLSNGNLTAFVLSSQRKSVLIDSLKRPVHMTHGDLDRDGDNDILISCFGNFTGSLLLFENIGNGFVRHYIHHLPGTRRTVLRDVNGDGLLDIIALITQGNEQITLFENQGNLTFSSSILLQFPPVYGSSYFDLVDMNGDGLEDILYCNGDNADFSNVLKPYHGIRVYRNNGQLNFTEKFFLPMPGAFQASAKDFDDDGDIDIAAIAYFPDFNKFPQQSFVHFENTGETFIRHSSPAFGNGRWIVMETGDFDQDNDHDIILGALNFNIGTPDSVFSRWRRAPLSLQLLENTTRR